MKIPASYYTRHADALYSRLDVFRRLMPDAKGMSTEIGAHVENGVRGLLRQVLPDRFGLAFGHVLIESEGDWDNTKPLDIIVYDALNYGPVFAEGDFAVVAPQAVLAVVEVKTDLGAKFELARKQIGRVREALEGIPGLWWGRDSGEASVFPGFILGMEKATGKLWKLGEGELTGTLMAYCELSSDQARFYAGRWRHAQEHGFAYWYWSLIDTIYRGTGAITGHPVQPPVPANWVTLQVDFEKGDTD